MTQHSPQSGVKYFTGPWLPLVGHPTVAITYDEAVPPTIYAEAFVFIESNDSELYFEQRISANRDNIAPAGDPRDILETEALRWSQAVIDDRIMAIGGKGVTPPSWHWAPATDLPLLRFWLRGRFCEQLTRCRRVTKSEAFRNHLAQCSPSLKNSLSGTAITDP